MKMNYKNIIKLILILTTIMIAFSCINTNILAANFPPNNPPYTEGGGSSADFQGNGNRVINGVDLDVSYHSFFTGTVYYFKFYDGETYDLTIKAGETIGY